MSLAGIVLGKVSGLATHIEMESAYHFGERCVCVCVCVCVWVGVWVCVGGCVGVWVCVSWYIP